jgi:hypothetical protein
MNQEKKEFYEFQHICLGEVDIQPPDLPTIRYIVLCKFLNAIT